MQQSHSPLNGIDRHHEQDSYDVHLNMRLIIIAQVFHNTPHTDRKSQENKGTSTEPCNQMRVRSAKNMFGKLATQDATPITHHRVKKINKISIFLGSQSFISSGKTILSPNAKNLSYSALLCGSSKTTVGSSRTVSHPARFEFWCLSTL